MSNPARNGQRRVALIGAGAVAEPHLLAYQSMPNVDIVGVVEPRQSRLDEIANRYSLRGFTSVESLLEHAQPEIACILTPAATHRKLTEQCAAAGVHVLCEKPMAVTLQDAQAMSRACESAGVKFFYGSSYRFLPAVQQARELIRSGAIGKVRLITEHLLGGSGAREYQPMSAAHYPNGGPGGGGYGLVDHGIHMLDIFPWLIDSPITRVLGRGDRTGVEARTEFALLSMRNGATGILMYDGSTRSSDLPWEGVFSEGRAWVDGRGWVGETGQWECGAGSLRIYGTEGSLRVFHYANRLFLNRSGTIEELRVEAGTTPRHFGTQLQQFCDDLMSQRRASSSDEDGIRALRVLHAIYESERQGSWHRVDEQ